MYDELRKLSLHFLETKNALYRRYFLRSTSLTHRMSLIMGPRGVGKTTTLIQHLLDCVTGDRFDPRIFYVQADHFLMSSASLYEIAEQFQMHGGKWIVFDEIHKYPNWSKELKSIYDTFEHLTIFASGSSALEISKGSHDLTRRALVYHMQGMSLREYLELAYQIHLPTSTIQEICQNHAQISHFVVKELKKIDKHILTEFHRYLRIGYYPYFYEVKNEFNYKITLEQNAHTTIDSDLASIHPQLTGITLQKIKKLLIFIANAVPFTPNWSHLMTALEIGDIRTLKTYFSHLEDAGLLKSLSKATKKFHSIESSAKIYLENPNQLYAISANTPEKGTIRETFFLNAVSQKYDVSMPLEGDFFVEGLLFEVGGKNKHFDQIKQYENGYLACDDIEQSAGKKIPLWLFGFLY